jgi:hypothetical protein
MEGQSHSIGEIFSGPAVGTVGRLVSIPAALVTSGILQALALPFLTREALRAPSDHPGRPVEIAQVPPPPGADPTPEV